MKKVADFFNKIIAIIGNIIVSPILFSINISEKIVEFWIKTLKKKPVLFIFTIFLIALTIVSFYFHSTGIASGVCYHNMIFCFFRNDVVNFIMQFEVLWFVLALAGFIFILPKNILEKIWYYIFEFSNDCERKYLIPLIIIHAFVILLMPYLFFWVIPKPDYSLSPEKMAFYNTLLGLLMIVMIGVGFMAFNGLSIAWKRLFDKDDRDYKEIGKSKSYSEFLYGVEPKPKSEPEPDKKLDTFRKKDEK